MNFNKFSKNDDNIKSDQKTKLYTLFREYIFIYILRVNAWIFLNETLMLDFAKLEIFYSI